MSQRPCAVLGAGAWGTALAIQIARQGRRTILWARSEESAAVLRSEGSNERYLPGVAFPPSLEVVSDLGTTVDCDPVLVVVPSQGFRQVVHDFLSLEGAEQSRVLVSCTKGIESDSLKRMSEVVEAETAALGLRADFAVLSGPSFAQELAGGSPTAAVIASGDQGIGRRLQEELSGGNLRLYSSSDVIGVELGGTIKNVIAIAAGCVGGLGLGHNTRAALITRGLHEMTRLGVACGGRAATFSGLAGLGDLVLTCTSSLSRNERVGERLGRGESLDAVPSRGIAEGVRNSAAVLELARRCELEMPITEQMVEVLYAGKSPRQAVEQLMSRQLRSESES